MEVCCSIATSCVPSKDFTGCFYVAVEGLSHFMNIGDGCVDMVITSTKSKH